ncbi:hypothetical protein HY404_00205 [Candidatus Microgenomates bacterium]|nr:hypothetical protein [Candidatus Microgenomates bacterium]
MAQNLSPESGISEEVVGKLSDPQQRELNNLGLSLLQLLELDSKNPQDVERVKNIIEDFIWEGLALSGRRWVSSADRMESVFNLGLDHRQKIISQLREISLVEISYFATDAEGSQIKNLTNINPFSQEYPQVAELLESIKGRKSQVNKFQRLLFNTPELAQAAVNLTREVRQQNAQGIHTEDRLYANFLAHLVLYRRPGLDVEPKDIAVLIDLWENPEARKRSQAAVIRELVIMAEKLGVTPAAVEIYTKGVFDQINQETWEAKDVDAMRRSYFIISNQSIREEERELRPTTDQSLYLSQNEVETLRAKYSQFRELLIEHLTLAAKLKEIPPENWQKYHQFLNDVTPLELIFLLKGVLGEEKADLQPERELAEFVPPQTFLDALPLIFHPIKEHETGQIVSDLASRVTRAKIQLKIKDKVIEAIFAQEFAMSQLIAKAPISILADLMQNVSPARLNEEEKDAFCKNALSIWSQLPNVREISYDADNDNLLFDADAADLKAYFDILPDDTQQAIIKNLRRMVTL